MKKNPMNADGKTPISRRRFVRAATAISLGTVCGGIPKPLAGAEAPLQKELSPDVQMQFMRPAGHSSSTSTPSMKNSSRGPE